MLGTFGGCLSCYGNDVCARDDDTDGKGGERACAIVSLRETVVSLVKQRHYSTTLVSSWDVAGAAGGASAGQRRHKRHEYF
jgi:hypothetical protein